MRFLKTRTFVFGIGLFMFIPICRASPAFAAEPKLKTVVVAYTSYTPFMTPLLLEKELGFFRDEGLRPEFVFIRGGGIAIKGMLAGNLDYLIHTGAVMDGVIRSRLPLKILLTTQLVYFWLVAQPEIRSISDLKGKSVGISSFGSNTDFTMREILKRRGLDPLKQTTFLGVGSSRERFAALTSGAVQATLLSPPFSFRALKMGYQKLASASDYVKWPQGGLATTEDKIRRDPAEATGMIRASLKALKFLLTQKQYLIPKIMEKFHLSPEEALQTTESFQDESLAAGYLSEDAARAVISMVQHAANVNEDTPTERVFDNRFVKQAEQDLKGWRPEIPKR
jgi:ABC-type nitrate/sulfonate/bicarbonate transport system substrate-binding protein